MKRIVLLLAALTILLAGCGSPKTTQVSFSGHTFNFYDEWKQSDSSSDFTIYKNGVDNYIILIKVDRYDERFFEQMSLNLVDLARRFAPELENVKRGDNRSTSIDGCKALIVPFYANDNEKQCKGRLYCVSDPQQDQSIAIALVYKDSDADEFLSSFDSTIEG